MNPNFNFQAPKFPIETNEKDISSQQGRDRPQGNEDSPANGNSYRGGIFNC